MTILVKCQGRSSIPALTLWVSPLSIYMVLLNTVGLQMQIINWTEQFTKTIIIRYLSVLINLLALNLLMLFLKLNKMHQNLIICTVWWKRSWLPLCTLKRYRFWHLYQIHGRIDIAQNILTAVKFQHFLSRQIKCWGNYMKIYFALALSRQCQGW